MSVEASFYYFWVLVLLAANCLAWWSTIYSLPGNWFVVGFTALFAALAPVPRGQEGVGWLTVGVVLLLAVAGEAVEFGAAGIAAARRGASRRGAILSLVGAVLGSIAGLFVGLPIPLIGSAIAAILGGAAGAFAGAYMGEHWKGRPHAQRVEAGVGALAGRLWGTVAKLSLGAVMVVVVTFDSLLLGW